MQKWMQLHPFYVIVWDKQKAGSREGKHKEAQRWKRKQVPQFRRHQMIIKCFSSTDEKCIMQWKEHRAVSWKKKHLERDILWSLSTATTEVPMSKALNLLTVTTELSLESHTYTGLHLKVSLYNCIKHSGAVLKNLNHTLCEGKHTLISAWSHFCFPCYHPTLLL